MKTLRIKRPAENVNKNFAYDIIIGKKIITSLKNGEEKVIEIPEELENESIYAKIYWCGSKKCKVTNILPNDTLIISGNEFLNNRLPLIIGLFPVVGIMIFSSVNSQLKNLGIGILLILLIFLIGTLTIGRKKWLKAETAK